MKRTDTSPVLYPSPVIMSAEMCVGGCGTCDSSWLHTLRVIPFVGPVGRYSTRVHGTQTDLVVL